MAHDLVEHRLLTGMGMLVHEPRQDTHVGLEVLMGPPVDKLGVRPPDLETTPRDRIGYFDAVEECKQHLERLGVARSDEKVDVVLARWVELGAQIEGPGLGIEFDEKAAEKYPWKPYDRPVIVQQDGGIGLE